MAFLGWGGVIVSTLLVFHDWESLVVGFLEEGLAIVFLYKAPYVVRPTREFFKCTAVGAEARQLTLAKGNGFAAIGKCLTFGSSNVGVVKEPLCQVIPSTGCALELVGEQMGVLYAEAVQHDVESLGFSVLVFVIIVPDLGAVLYQCPFRSRVHAQGYDQAFCKNTRSVWARSVWLIKHEHHVPTALSVFCDSTSFVLVSIDGVFVGGHRPHTTRGIPLNGDWFTHPLGFGGYELSGKSIRKVEACQLLGRRGGSLGNTQPGFFLKPLLLTFCGNVRLFLGNGFPCCDARGWRQYKILHG